MIVKNYNSKNFNFVCDTFEVTIDEKNIKYVDKYVGEDKGLKYTRAVQKKFGKLCTANFDSTNIVYRRMLSTFNKKHNWNFVGFGLESKDGAAYLNNFVNIKIENMLESYSKKLMEVL